MNAYEKVKEARSRKRPTSIDYISSIFSSFIELHGDRLFRDDEAIIGGLAYLDDIPVTVIGIEKGKSTMESLRRSFGSPNPEGYRKAVRLMKSAEKFNRPVITFVDTAGAYCGVGAEERGQGEAIANSILTMIGLNVPVISILIGEGGSGGALALLSANEVWMLENSVYSVISPEGCASILYKDQEKAAEVAGNLRLTAEDALALGVADRVISEKNLGEKEFYQEISSMLKEKVNDLQKCADVRSMRYDRFRKIGGFAQ